MISFEAHEKYAFVFAHPDDEIYTAAIMRSLVDEGKDVYAVYLTNGDYAGAAVGQERQKELAKSMALIGVKPGQLTILGLAERALFDNAEKAIAGVVGHIEDFKPDCVVGHDYEAGHNAHDLASFCAFLGARTIDANFWVFPAYHGTTDARRWNQFTPGKTTDYTRPLSEEGLALKMAVIRAHATQEEFFGSILASTDAADFLKRDVLRFAGGTIDYQAKPTDPLGYEVSGAGTPRFDLLQSVISRYMK